MPEAPLTSVGGLGRRDRLLISACLAVTVLLAWSYLVYLARQMSGSSPYDAAMQSMDSMSAWSWPDVFFTFVMWTVMMVGMMAAAAWPVLTLFASASAGRGAATRSRVLVFALGYFVVWTGFSAVAAGAQWGLHEGAWLSDSMSIARPQIAGGILIAAGIYQVTSWKNACLTQCRSPLGFLMTNWRDGTLGAFTMGLRHGTWCLGCCWALMLVLFAVGVMNLVWVFLLAGVVLLEKVSPMGTTGARLVGAALVVFGVVVAFRH